MAFQAFFRQMLAHLKATDRDAFSETNAFFVDGQFYGQRFRVAPGAVLPNGCLQIAFFHFQEWKKLWLGHGAFGLATTGINAVGVAPHYSARDRNFTVTTEGITLLR